MPRFAFLILVSFAFVQIASAGDIPATFTQLGYLYYPEGVSNGGKVVVGNLYNDNPFIIGPAPVGGLPQTIHGVSADGKTIVGTDASGLPAGPKQTPDLYTGDTLVVSPSGKQMAGVAIPYLPSGNPAPTQAFAWTDAKGFSWIPTLENTKNIKMTGMSADGKVVVGYNDAMPVLWNLGDNASTVQALNIAGDPRQLIAGDWSWLYQTDGMAAFKQFLLDHTAIDETLLAKYEFKSAFVSPDGTAITGYAAKNGFERGYLVTFGEAPTSPSPGGGPAPTPEPSSVAIALVAVAGLLARRGLGL